MKIFFVASEMPFPGFSGSNIIHWSIVNFLINEGHHLYLFCDPPRFGVLEIDKKINHQMYEKIKSLNCELVTLNNIKINIKKKNIIQRIFSNKFEDYYSNCHASKEIEEILKNKTDEVNPDLIMCYGSAAIHWTKNLKTKRVGVPSVPEVIFYKKAKLIEKNIINIIKYSIAYIKVKLFQKQIIKESKKLDLSFNISRDWNLFLNKLGLKSEHLLPIFFDSAKLIKRKEKTERSFFKIILVGLMSTKNKTLCDILRKYVFPKIEKEIDLNKIQFHFIGTNHDDLPDDFKNKSYVIARGFVDDFADEVYDSDLFFCPTPYDLGLSTRLCDALCLGSCILTSEFDKISLPFLKDKYNCYIVDDLKNTGSLLIQIMKNKDLNKQIKLNARKSYEQFLSFESAGKKYNDFLTLNTTD